MFQLMRSWSVLLFFAALSCKAQIGLAQEKPSLQLLAWLHGEWISQNESETVEEYWMAPRGSMMLGINRTVTSKGRTAFENMRIELKDDKLIFFASPSGKSAVAFPAVKLEASRVVFENGDHDFPNRIVYEREGNVLTGSIEGEINGKKESMVWKWNLNQPGVPSR